MGESMLPHLLDLHNDPLPPILSGGHLFPASPPPPPVIPDPPEAESLPQSAVESLIAMRLRESLEKFESSYKTEMKNLIEHVSTHLLKLAGSLSLFIFSPDAGG